MKIQRVIAVYQKNGEALIEEIIISLTTEFLIELFQIDIEGDPNVYLCYFVNESHFLKLKNLIPVLSKYDLNEVEMYVECFQIN
ncbi:hypothetical protein [Flavobacterium sp. AED]|uniref:DUF7683 domain-containing protein n=1 Tax=Flavobacterium sp. AED TaxID=1423323 RepID=UPI0005808136|nr:hypothetical protein [Flavobacterium sp. AED]KIA87184.1 hypothetical protein OA85_06130 [Flavobacterium sp. AED]MDI1306127.1 hypothetical protein [bacterium]